MDEAQEGHQHLQSRLRRPPSIVTNHLHRLKSQDLGLQRRSHSSIWAIRRSKKSKLSLYDLQQAGLSPAAAKPSILRFIIEEE